MGLRDKIVKKVEDVVFGKDERTRAEIEEDLKKLNDAEGEK